MRRSQQLASVGLSWLDAPDAPRPVPTMPIPAPAPTEQELFAEIAARLIRNGVPLLTVAGYLSRVANAPTYEVRRHG